MKRMRGLCVCVEEMVRKDELDEGRKRTGGPLSFSLLLSLANLPH